MQDRNPSTARIKLCAAAFVVALLGFSSSAARAQVRVPTHVACVGDSITYGYLASNQATKSYPADLQTLFGSSIMVKNYGRNAATLLSSGDQPYLTYDMGAIYTAARTFVSNAGAGAVVDVIIMLGTNDSKPLNWSPADAGGMTRAQQYAIDLGNLIDDFTSLSTHPVVYLALPAAIYTNSFGISESVTHNEIAPIIMQVAAQKGMPVIDVHTPTSGHPEYFQDGVHPTDAGYMLLAQIMHDGLLAGGGGTGGRGGSGGAGGAGGGAGRGGAGGGAAGRGGAGGSAGTGGAGGRGGAAGGAAGRGGSGGGSGAGGAGGSTTGTGGTGGGTAGAGGAATGSGGATAGAGGAGVGAGGSGVSGAGGTSPAGAGGSGPGTGGAGGVGTGGASVTGAGGAAGGTPESGGGGCGCDLGGGPPAGFAAVGILLLALARRRRTSA